jgi:hypothetical protein
VKYFILSLSLFGLTQMAIAQSTSTLMGARAHGLAHTSVTLEDEWSLFNNVAGLAKQNGSFIAATHIQHPSLTSFNKSALTFSSGLKTGAIGVGAFRFGDDLYNEQLVTIGYAVCVGNTSLGIKTNYNQFNAEGFGRKANVTFSMGTITKLSSHITVGIHIHNILQPNRESSITEHQPTIIMAGIGIKASENFNVFTELEKEITTDVGAKAGIEYHYQHKFYLRTGYHVLLNTMHVGVGLHKQRYHIDYSFSQHPYIGISHQATVYFLLTKKKA